MKELQVMVARVMMIKKASHPESQRQQQKKSSVGLTSNDEQMNPFSNMAL